MDKKKFFNQIRKLESAYRSSPCSEETLRVYWEQLNGFSDDWLVMVVDKLIATERFFPAPAVFLQYRGLERRACPVCKSRDYSSWIDGKCGECYRVESPA